MVEDEEKSTNESKEILSARTRSLLQYCFDSCCEQTSEDRSSLVVQEDEEEENYAEKFAGDELS